MLNGDGLRVVLWVAGCNHCCRECQNPITWDPNGGLPFTEKEEAEIFAELDKDYISGITFSGGDPLHPSNVSAVTALARKIRIKYPDKTIWLYTGSRWEEIRQEEILRYLDVLVDGEFQVEGIFEPARDQRSGDTSGAEDRSSCRLRDPGGKHEENRKISQSK